MRQIGVKGLTKKKKWYPVNGPSVFSIKNV